MRTVRTTIEPWREIVVSETEYLALLRVGLVYTGTIPGNPPPAFTDAQYLELGSENGEAALRILQAVTGSDIYNNARAAVMNDVLSLGYIDVPELNAELVKKSDTTHGHALTDANITGVLPVAQLPSSTTSARGGVELATTAEALAGTDTVRAVTPSGLKAVADTKADLVGGLVPTSQLPPLAVNETFVVASQAAMLALTAERGDIAVRTDNGRTYILATDAPATLADWKEVMAAGDVKSVAGKTGTVALVKADVGLGNVDNTSDASKPVSTAQQAALNGKANTSHTHTTAQVTGLDTALAAKADLVSGIVPSSQLPPRTATDAYDFRLDPAKWLGPVGERVTVPTHMSPAGGQTTHPSVLFFPEKWNGYRYWMAHTPYPAGNDDHEDPNLAVSNDGVTWIAAPGVTQPLDDADGTPEYNSDTALAMGPGGRMYLFWRFYDSSLGSNQEKLYMRTSTDGVTWTAKQLVWQYTQTTLRPVSPSFIFENDKWTVYAVDIKTAGSPRMIRMTSNTSDPLGGWSAATTCTIASVPSGKAPWHLDVIRIGGQYVGLLCAADSGTSGVNGILTLIVSTDGTTWVSSPATVIPTVQSGEHNVLYRATLVPEFRDGVLGLRVWYGAWMDTTPSVWNIYRTWIGPTAEALPKLASGFHAYTTLINASTGVTLTIPFPAGTFSTPPTVVASVGGSSRLQLAVTAVSATDFTVRIDNFTTGNGAPTGVYWQAIG